MPHVKWSPWKRFRPWCPYFLKIICLHLGINCEHSHNHHVVFRFLFPFVIVFCVLLSMMAYNDLLSKKNKLSSYANYSTSRFKFKNLCLCENLWDNMDHLMPIRVIGPTNLEAIDIMNIEYGRKSLNFFKKRSRKYA